MGDVIQVIDTFSANTQLRMTDNKKILYEICIIYPESMNKDNVIIKCNSEDEMQFDLEAIADIIDGEFGL